jgi:hypothetical protein
MESVRSLTLNSAFSVGTLCPDPLTLGSELGVMFGYEIQRDYGCYQRTDKTAD